jgi:hypothetical protein
MLKELSVKVMLTVDRAIGPTKVFKNPAAPAVILYVPIALARILFETTSAG